MSYTQNPFDILGDDGEDRPRKQAVKQPKPQAPQTAAPAKPVEAVQQKAAPAKPSPSNAKKDSDVKPKTQGDTPKGKSEAPAKKPAAQARPQQQQAPAGRDPNYESEKPQRAPKDKRDARDRPARTRGRENDRKSGTGRAPNENKRSGAGKNNWGAIDDTQEATEANKENTEEKEDATANPAGAGEGEPEPPKEPEKEYKTLDEHLESIKGKTVKNVEPLKLRAAGEGVDQSAWAGYAPLSKDEDADAEALRKKKSAAKKAVAEAANGKEEKVAVDKLFRVTVPPPQGVEERGQRGDRRGRGGKGPSRGGRNDRGNGRQQADKSKTIEHDLQNFPALGGSSPVPAQQASSPAAVKA